MKPIRPPFGIHGGKNYLKHWVISHFPVDYEYKDYIEPFVGAGNVFLNKKHFEDYEGYNETINDLCFERIALWRTIKDDVTKLINKLLTLKYEENTFLYYRDNSVPASSNSYIFDCAVREFVLRRMSRGSLGKAYAWQDRLRGGKPGSINSWETAIENLKIVSKRLENTFIENKDAIKLLEESNSSGNFSSKLVYADPPYLLETRTAKKCYENEMCEDDHIRLGECLNKLKAHVVLSGYNSKLYDKLYKGWRKVEKEVVNHAGQNKKKEKRTEVLWLNF